MTAAAALLLLHHVFKLMLQNAEATDASVHEGGASLSMPPVRLRYSSAAPSTPCSSSVIRCMCEAAAASRWLRSRSTDAARSTKLLPLASSSSIVDCGSESELWPLGPLHVELLPEPGSASLGADSESEPEFACRLVFSDTELSRAENFRREPVAEGLVGLLPYPQ